MAAITGDRAVARGAKETTTIETATRTAHFVGAGGIGMSAAALLFSSRGWRVSGSDIVRGAETARLEDAGLPVSVGHRVENLPEVLDLLVHSAAIDPDNPELVEARRRGVEVIPYARSLARLGRGKDTYAVAGTHGKTTTTAILTTALECAGQDPLALVGGRVLGWTGNLRQGQGQAFVVEACEYRESFLELTPRHAIITNVDEDHLDHYGNVDRLRAAFRAFAARLPKDGCLVTSAQVARELDLRGAVAARLCTIGTGKKDVRVEPEPAGEGFVLVHPDGRRSPAMHPHLPGDHNVMNAAMAALLACEGAGASPEAAAAAVAAFRGVERRFEIVRDGADVTIVDDYAHHPAEIEATLQAARRRYAGRPLVAVFQPHLEARTRRHFPDFLNAIAIADRAILMRDYRVAGRDFGPCAGAERMSASLAALGMPCLYAAERERVRVEFSRRRGKREVWLIMGAGDIRGLAGELAQRVS